MDVSAQTAILGIPNDVTGQKLGKIWPKTAFLDSLDQDDPEHNMTRREREHLVRQALVTLPPVEREVFMLRQAHGCSVQTIATRQACSVSTVNYRLRQARQRLAAKLSTWSDCDFSHTF